MNELSEKKASRKGKVVTMILGEDMKSRIPRVMDNIYKLEAFPVKSDQDISKDETFRGYTLRTILVEGTSVVDGGKAISVNGEFEISLQPNHNDNEESMLLEQTYNDKEEAVRVWNILTDSQHAKAIEVRKDINDIIEAIENYKRDQTY